MPLYISSYLIKVACLTGFLLVLFLNAFAEDPHPRMKRICISKNGQEITVSWYNDYGDCGTFGFLELYGRENEQSPYKLITTITDSTQTEYVHLNATQFARGSYYLIATIGCPDKSPLWWSDTMKVDLQAPAVVHPDSISVNDNGNVELGWTAPPDKDVKSYVIYRTEGGINKAIDTVYGKFNTFFEDVSGFGTPFSNPEQFKIAAVDSCDNIAPIGNYHQTINLNVSQDSCKKEIYLNWQSYAGWPEGVDRYVIYSSSSEDSIVKPLRSVDGGVHNFTFTEGINGVNYTFLVRAYKRGQNSITSTSNRYTMQAAFNVTLDYLYITHVTTSDSGIEIHWAVPHPKGVDKFVLYKGMVPARLEKVEEIQAHRINRLYHYLDETADQQKVWYYRVEAYNTCASLIAVSNISNNIVLKIERSDSGRVLRWNAYEDWEGRVKEYELHRNTTNVLKNYWHLLAVTDTTQTWYLDSELIDEYGFEGLCYYVIANEGTANQFGFEERSRSNKVCYADYPIVHIPNAFVPDGLVDTVFKPIVLFADTRASSMKIYNRWGQRIYTSTDITEGWNGRLPTGRQAPVGVYMYEIIIKGIDQSTQIFRGIVNLL